MEDKLEKFGVERLQREFNAYLTNTQENREEAERDRDYVDHKQWTQTEKDELNERGQAPSVNNRIKRRLNRLLGTEAKRSSDPKAYPRTPEHEGAAEAATDALRYVDENNDFSDETANDCFEDMLVEGTAAAIVEVELKGKEPEIVIRRIPWDRYYHSVHARRLDLKDSDRHGIVIWMGIDEAKEEWPDKADKLTAVWSSNHTDGSETFDDRPRWKWIDEEKDRIRVCEEYRIIDGVWHRCVFTHGTFLEEWAPSPYLDEDGEPICPIESQSAYVDRENNRYGEVRSMIWDQDKINHRESKLQHQLNNRQTIGEKGAVDDVYKAKQELSRPDGHVEVLPGKRFELLNTNDMSMGQLELLREAKADIDYVSIDPEVAASGRSREVASEEKLDELGRIFKRHVMWKRRIYRQVWNRVKQFWTAPKWVRVTDDEDDLRFVGLNQPVTVGEQLRDMAQQGDQDAAAILQQMIQTQDPRLNEVMETKNNVAEMDVDIIIAEGQNTIIQRQEQFETLANLAQVYGPQAVPFEVILELSGMPDKKRVIDKLRESDPEKEQMRKALEQIKEMLQSREEQRKDEEHQSDMAESAADIRKTEAETIQKELENIILQTTPVESANVIV